MDHVKVIDSWPPQDALANILSESFGNGGAPYNILKNLAKLPVSYPLEAIGLVGEDGYGKRIMEDCRAHGIDATQMRVTSDTSTSYTDVMTEKTTGRRTFFHRRGTNALLAPEHFDFSQTPAKFFHFGYLLLLDTLDELQEGRPRAVEVLTRAQDVGIITSLDCVSENSERFAAVAKPLLPHVDILFLNDYEAEKLTGIPLQKKSGAGIDRGNAERAAKALRAFGVGQWVIIHFPEGAVAFGKEGDLYWHPSVAVPASAIAGVAGAGDAFATGVLHGLHEGQSIETALRYGVCVAASSLSEATCSGGILPLDDCLRLAETHGWNE